jgi:hypothetical protein
MNDVDRLIYIRQASDSLNIEVILHFHEKLSEQTRAGRMDLNRDRVISTVELDQYCTSVDRKVLKRFGLQVAGRSIPLVDLYRPEVDLLGVRTVQAAPHFLKLFFTTTLPPSSNKAETDEFIQFTDRSFATMTGRSQIEVRDQKGELLKTSIAREISFPLLNHSKSGEGLGEKSKGQ